MWYFSQRIRLSVTNPLWLRLGLSTSSYLSVSTPELSAASRSRPFLFHPASLMQSPALLSSSESRYRLGILW